MVSRSWRVRADKIDNMFSGRTTKDKPPFRWGMRLFYATLFVFSLCMVGAVAFRFPFAWASRGHSMKHGQAKAGSPGGHAGVDKHQQQALNRLATHLGETDVDAAIHKLNQQFSQLPTKEQPKAVLNWVIENVPEKRWCQFTSFGPTGLATLHMISRLAKSREFCVGTIDTLHLFPETYELMKRVQKHFGLMNLRVIRPEDASTKEEFEERYGQFLWRADPHLFDFVTKVQPMRKGLDELDVLLWVTGRRKSQGGERASLPLIEVDPVDGRVKVNPLANWSKEDVWSFIHEHKIPYNTLHDEGFQSIGDTVTTVRTAPDAPERAGRFKGQNRTECGMHVATSSDSAQQMLSQAALIRSGYEWDHKERAETHALGVVQTTEESFPTDVVEVPGHVLLEVYAPWCGHCQHFAGTFREIATALRAGGGGGRRSEWHVWMVFRTIFRLSMVGTR